MLAPCPEGAVLVLHSPPKGHCDSAGDDTHFGSPALLAAIEEKRPRLAVCGHIHESWGCEGEVGHDADPQPRPERHLDRALGTRGGERPQARRAGPGDADPRRRGRQPQPRRRQRRPAGHRQGLRRRPDDGRPDRGRLLARARRLGPLPRRGRRPLRPQVAAAAGDGADDPDLDLRRLRPLAPRPSSSPASPAASPPAWPTRPRWR